MLNAYVIDLAAFSIGLFLHSCHFHYTTTILYVTSVLNEEESGKFATPPKVIVCGPGVKVFAGSNAQ